MHGVETHARIIAALPDVEQDENVRIIQAAKAGGRAWGLAARDSDCDVRFIYVRRNDEC